jgi:hypothetical protein
VTAKAAAIARHRRVAAYLRTTITTDPAGKPTFTWSFDQTAIDTEATSDGWYALLTNLDATIDTTEVLHRYKDQPVVERRYSDIKGPLAVAPIFLQHNRRITALITVICLALLIFCLIEARTSLYWFSFTRDPRWRSTDGAPPARLSVEPSVSRPVAPVPRRTRRPRAAPGRTCGRRCAR